MERIASIDNELDFLWGLASDRELLYRGWNDEFVVYNHCSGDTHLLDGTAMALLRALQDGPVAGVDLASAVPLSGEAVVAMLADLESLGLILATAC